MPTTLDELLPLLTELGRTRGHRRSLAELAREAECSPSTFQRAFSRLAGESPKQLMRRLQLEHAAVLLMSTRDSVLDVALAAGFESHEGFTRAFSAWFGQAPLRFRQEAIRTGLADDDRHAELLTHVGPCLRLFRASTESRSVPGVRTMSYDITIQRIPAVTLLAMTARSGHGEIAQALGRILPEVFRYVTTHGIALAGPPTTIYEHWGPGLVTLRAGMPVGEGAQAEGEIEVVSLEAGEAAVTIHTGPYDGLPDAHAAVEVFLEEQGRTSAGPPREVYLTDPGEVPDPAEWKTQIVWPVAS